MNFPDISIIIPVFAPGPLLNIALTSIFQQELPSATLEVIAINDCSPDDSATVLQQWSAVEPRLRTQTLEVNSGAGLARNAGLAMARGRYVAFLDPDDSYPPGALAALLTAAESSDCPMIRGNIIEFDEQGVGHPRETNISVPGPRAFAETAVLWTPWMHQQFLFRREFLEKYNIRYPHLRRGQDTVMLARALARCQVVECIDTVVYHYKIGVKSGKWGLAQFDNILDHFYMVREAYLDAGYTQPWNNYLNVYWSFWRHLQNGAAANMDDDELEKFFTKSAPLFMEVDNSFYDTLAHRSFPLNPWKLLVYRLLQKREFVLLLAILRSGVRLDALMQPVSSPPNATGHEMFDSLNLLTASLAKRINALLVG